MSLTTVAALTNSVNVEECHNVYETAKFIETVAKWFQLMNTYTPAKCVIEAKNACGKCQEIQNQILDDMALAMQTMQCCDKTKLQVFQKGCLISIKSTKDLLKDLKSSLSIDFVLTHRLNQDALDNLFSQIRTRGGLNDHPTPLNALFRIRMTILGKNQCDLKNNQH